MSAPFNQSDSWREGIHFIHPTPSHRTADALFAKHGMVRLLLTAVTTRVRGSLFRNRKSYWSLTLNSVTIIHNVPKVINGRCSRANGADSSRLSP
jgi:hypothetical protein